MHAHILTGGSPASRAQYCHDLSQSQTELIHVQAEKSTLTIKQIKDLWEPLSIAPRIPRVVWIEEANLLTTPAQNALLKLLEEPPAQTTFYLSCSSSSLLLPTIRSRCQIISLGDNQTPISTTVLTELKSIMALSPGDRLTQIVKRDRSESLSWVQDIELSLRERLKDHNLPVKSLVTLAKIARLAQNLRLQLASNCSVSLATQNFYLLLPHTHSTS